MTPRAAHTVSISVPATRSEVEVALGEGRHFLYRYASNLQPHDFDRALTAFERALQLDPYLSIAAGYLAYLFALKGWKDTGRDFQEAQKSVKQAKSWARRALALDQRCGVAWSATAFMESYRGNGDLEKALGCAIKGASLAPRDALSNHSMGECSGFDLMVASGLHSLEIDPLDFGAAGMVAVGLVWLGRTEEALGIVERALLMDPDNVYNQIYRAYALTHVGRLREAQGILERFEPAPTAWDQRPFERSLPFTFAVR